MKKLLSIIAILLIIQSCDDKKTQQFGGVNLTIKKQEYSNDSELQPDIDVDIKLDQEDFELKILKDKEIIKSTNSNLIFNNYRVKTIIEPVSDELEIESLQNQIADIDAVRVALNNGQPTTIPLINGSATYSRDGLAIGVIPIKVDLLGGGLEKYTQTKSISIVANQNAAVSFNSFFVMNQQISITNSSFGSTVIQGDQISFEWTNTHSERPVQISVIQNNENNIIQILESSFVGTAYTLNTGSSNPANNIGFKISSNVASNTSSSICCFDLVANAPQANDISSTVNEDSSLTIQLDGSSPGGESVTYSIVSNPSNGSLSSISGSNITYTPNQDFNGSDTFTYKANNGAQDSNTATVTITVNNVNDAPVVKNLSTSTSYQQQVSIELSGSDIDGDNLTYFINSNPSNGTIAFTGSNSISYSPNSGFSGSDSFNYGASDGSLDSNVATVSITVEAQTVQVTYPVGGEEFIFGETIDITWNGGFSNTGVYLIKGEQPRLSISGDVGGANSYQWTIPSSAGLEVGSDYKIRIYDAGAGEEFSESNTFTITDSSTGGNPTYSENNNSSLLFGEDSVIKLTEIDEDLGKIGSSMTISLWFKTTHNPNQDVLIHGNGSSAQFGHLGFTTAGAGGKAYLVSAGGTNLQLSDSNDFTNDRNWNHMAYVIDGDNSNIRFYVNGVLENSGSFSSGASFNAFDRQWEIGHWTKDSNQNFDFQGYIDDVGVWNTNLSDQEIADIYNDGDPMLAHKIKESNLRAYYDFEDNSMSNKTGREKNGTPIGNPISNVNVGFSSIVPGQSEDGESGKFKHPGGGSGAKGIKISPAGEVFSNEFTVSFYLKVDMNNDPNDKVHGILRSIFGASTPGFALRVHPKSASSNAGALDFTYSDGTQDNSIYSNFSLSNNTDWNHFTVVKNNNTVDFYVNGSLDKSHSVSFNNIGNSETYIGSASFDFSDNQHLDGLMDEFAFWDNSLNASQISTLASNGSPLGIMDSNLKMYYQFIANEGSNVIDHSGNDNNGIGQNGFSYSSDVPGAIDVNNAPTTEDINVTIDENRTNRSMVDITLEGNDIDGDNLSYFLTSTPNNGSFSINGNVLAYNANQDWNGVETFTYKANDGILDSNISTITITINAVNDNPVILPNNKSLKGEHDYINLGKVINFNNNNPQSNPPNLDSWTLLFNAKIDALDENGRGVILSTGENVQNRGLFFGVYTINGIPTLSLDYYNVDNLASGDISNIIGDGEYHSFAVLYSGSSARLLLDGVKVAENSFAANFGNENTDIWLGLSPWNNLNDLNGNINYGAIWLGQHAEEDILDMHNGTETPGDHPTNLQGWWDFNGSNSFEDLSTNNFTATYLTNGTEAENDNSTTFTLNEDTNITIDLDEYVYDVDSSSFTFSVNENPSNGVATLSNNELIYVPSANFFGQDSLSWKANDGEADSEIFTFLLNVSPVDDLPTTSDITETIDENRSSNRNVGITLLGSDVDGDALTYSLVTTPQNGTYSIDANILTYNANQDWNGVETFTYKANDGTFDSNTSSITITVNAVNDSPTVAVGDPFAENNKSGLFNGSSLVSLGTRGDLSGQDVITVQTWVAPNTSSQQSAATVIAKGTNINWTTRQYGMYLNKDSSAWNGQLGWSWGVSTNNGEKVVYSSSIANISEWTHLVGVYDGQKVKLYVNGVLDNFANHSGNINEASSSTNTPFSIGHLSSGGQYYFTGFIDEVAMWDVALSDAQVSDLYNVGLGMNALNLAASDLHGYWNFEDNFQDQSGNSRHGTGQGVTFDDNIPTGLYPNSFTTSEDTTLNIDLSSYVSDVDNDDLAVTFTSNASNGSLTANNLIITYTPNLNFNGNDSFSWSVSDGTVSTGAVNANIVVTSVNDAPVTTNLSATAISNQASDITLTSTDIESDSITYSIVSDVSNGSTSLNGAVVTYTPNSNFSGSDSFTFKANDGTDDSNVSTVAIDVTD